MEWREEGFLLSVRRHGESAAIVEVFTAGHGRHAGIVRGGASRRLAPVLQPGAQLDLAWRARLAEHMGSFQVEPVRSRAALVLADRGALAGLNAVCALLMVCLPERAAHPRLYQHSERLLDLLPERALWPLAYLRWEMLLLEEMGFGLDLGVCAVSGACENLAYISPKTGRAVAQGAAGQWRDRLLPLPPVLQGHDPANDQEMRDAFRVTGHFLHHHLLAALERTEMPPARARLMAEFFPKAGMIPP